MKFILILMFTSYGGSFDNVTFYDEPACKHVFEDLKRQDKDLKGGCYPLRSE